MRRQMREPANRHVIDQEARPGRAHAVAGSAGVAFEQRADQETFDALLEPSASGRRLEKHLVKGQPMAVVMHLVASCQIDLLAMGAGVSSGMVGWLLGGGAEQVLKVVPCSEFAETLRRSKAA